MFKETLYQSATDGTPFVDCLTRQGVLPGIKVRRHGRAGLGWRAGGRRGGVRCLLGWVHCLLGWVHRWSLQATSEAHSAGYFPAAAACRWMRGSCRSRAAPARPALAGLTACTPPARGMQRRGRALPSGARRSRLGMGAPPSSALRPMRRSWQSMQPSARWGVVPAAGSMLLGFWSSDAAAALLLAVAIVCAQPHYRPLHVLLRPTLCPTAH